MAHNQLESLLKLAELLDDTDSDPTPPHGTPRPLTDDPYIGRACIVRGDRSGVFYGTVDHIDGQTVHMTDARHVWYWKGANTTDDLARTGPLDPDACKITAPVAAIRVLDAITVLPCSDDAIKVFDAIPGWEAE